MCTRTTCRKCGKASWSGCGQHVSQVMQGIPKSAQCQGHANDPKLAKEGNFFSRLLGKK